MSVYNKQRGSVVQAAWKLPITRACALVLQEAGRELHYREITALLLQRGLVVSRSQALERCVYSGMSRHIRTTGRASWFAHAGPGKYELTPAGRDLSVWRSQDAWPESNEPKRQPRLDLTWEDAARRVLKEAGEPLHVSEILARIWANGYKPRIDAAVPQRTLGNLLAQLSHQRRRADGRIARVGPGTYAAR